MFRRDTSLRSPEVPIRAWTGPTWVEPELVRFLAHDGVPLTAWLYRPRAQEAPGPTVLSFHGGPEAQGSGPRFSYEYQVLLVQGIAVLAPNVRGMAGFGKEFVNLDNGELRFNAVRDIKACVEYVVSTGVAERGRIGIMGGSYGGYMTMAGLTDFSDHFAAGANLYGIVNYETFFQQTEPWMAAISKVEYGDPDSEVDLLRRLSPISTGSTGCARRRLCCTARTTPMFPWWKPSRRYGVSSSEAYR